VWTIALAASIAVVAGVVLGAPALSMADKLTDYDVTSNEHR
jgi:hypothetical protein